MLSFYGSGFLHSGDTGRQHPGGAGEALALATACFIGGDEALAVQGVAGDKEAVTKAALASTAFDGTVAVIVAIFDVHVGGDGFQVGTEDNVVVGAIVDGSPAAGFGEDAAAVQWVEGDAVLAFAEVNAFVPSFLASR